MPQKVVAEEERSMSDCPCWRVTVRVSPTLSEEPNTWVGRTQEIVVLSWLAAMARQGENGLSGKERS